MWTSEVSIDIEVPPADVFDYLADFSRHREWSSAQMQALRQLTSGPIGVGSEFEASETVPARVVTLSRITALDKPRTVAWHSWFGNLMAADWEFTISEAPAGTHLMQRSSWQPGNPIMALFHRFVRRRRIPVENRHSLERIKAALERALVTA